MNPINNYMQYVDFGLSLFVYIIVALLGSFVVSKLMNSLNYKYFPYPSKYEENKNIIEKYAKTQSNLLGIIERVLYLLAFQYNLLLFLSLWVSIKTLVKWKKWSTENGRLYFNNFLIGNGLNLLLSFLGFLAIHFLESHYLFTYHTWQVTIIWLLFVLFPYFLIFCLNCRLDEDLGLITQQTDGKKTDQIITHEKINIKIKQDITKKFRKEE